MVAHPAKARIPALDVARGIALSAMIVYHFAWDLSFLGFIETEVGRDPSWVTFARAIAGSFLFLVGIGLVLASEAGQSWGGFFRRLAKVGLAAAAITVATLVAFPDAFIFFGILHMIAVGSVLALPFLRAPVPLTLIAAALVLGLPHFVGLSAFDPLWLAWTGLYETPPPTVDFEPVFPWFGPVLLGVAAGRIIVNTRLRGVLAGVPVRGRLSRALQTMGRWSLVVYLVHQPILL
ncbi:MAG TPA: heparan-alpha-glucosaminide N-acetyltransferase, partial [Saliniramus sp.]|nr:heparan-alpha-glucosaminide N-acetyltransferase [Saliniramus sp.]